MKPLLKAALIVTACFVLLAASSDNRPTPQYDGKGQLLRPADYREWMFLSAGFGMNYSPAPGQPRNVHQRFRAALGLQRICEVRQVARADHVRDRRARRGEPAVPSTRQGHYQTDLMGLAVEVKDSAKNPDKWAYYGFLADGDNAGAMPHGQRLLRPATTRTPRSSTRSCSSIPR